MRRHTFLLLFASFLFLQLQAQKFDFRNYNVDDGLAQSQVFSIFQDYKGYMWFGTNGGGVSKFDGKKFSNYSVASGALSDYVYAIGEDRTHRIFLGTFDGLEIIGNFGNRHFDSSSGLPSNSVFSLLKDKNGKMWIGTQKGVCFLDENDRIIKLEGDSILSQQTVWSVFQDKNGNYWFGTREKGACRYKPGNKHPFQWFCPDNRSINWVRSINEDTKGNVYLGMVSGLFKVNASEEIIPITEDNLSFLNLGTTCISKDKNETFWIGTNEGIVKFNGLGCEQYREKNGLCGNTILCSFIDREGNLWFGSNGDGISKLTSAAWMSFSAGEGLPSDYISSIYQTTNGNYWFGVRTQGLCTWDSHKANNLSPFINYHLDPKNLKGTLVDNNVNALAEDQEGNLWIGTDAGISIFKDQVFINHLSASEYQTVYSILHTKAGKHYLGTGKGLILMEKDGKYFPIEKINKLAGKNDLGIYGLAEDRDQNIWIATSSLGAIEMKGDKIIIFDEKNMFTRKTVYGIAFDKNQNPWFGTEEGVYCYYKNKFLHISQHDGLSSNQAYFILPDKLDQIWIGTNHGIDVLNINDFLNSGKISLGHYGKSEGLVGMECNFNASFRDQEGKLWFGTVKGASAFNPRFEIKNYEEPRSEITGIRLNFTGTDLNAYAQGIDSTTKLPLRLRLPHYKNHLTFDFIGISQTNPDKVRYRFKLEGVDNDWVEPTSKTEATYSSLQPGTYTFFMKSCNNDGVWNREPVTFRFEILPPWYQTWWFYSVCVIVILLSIYAYNNYKTKKLRSDKLKLEKVVTIRTRELREEKEKVEFINKEVIEQKTIIEHKNLEITDSIKYAKNIQEALLPSVIELKEDFPDSFVIYMPKDIVSGDFYWFARKNGRNFIAAADCTGHGVPGAFMSIIGNSLLNEIVGEQQILQPSEILNHLHIGVKSALNQNKGEFERRDGMDIALCSIRKETNILEYAGANRPLWIYKKSAPEKVEIIKPDKFPIGGLEFDFEEKRQFKSKEIQLEKGDTFYLFSDGFADQFGGDRGKKFMVANLQRILAQNSHKSMQEQHQVLTEAFQKWRGTFEQIDDVLVIGVRL